MGRPYQELPRGPIQLRAASPTAWITGAWITGAGVHDEPLSETVCPGTESEEHRGEIGQQGDDDGHDGEEEERRQDAHAERHDEAHPECGGRFLPPAP